MINRLIFVLITLQLSACGLIRTPLAPPNDAAAVNSALVYGYVEAGDEVVEQVDLVEYGKIYVPPFNHPPRVLVYDNGMFLAENIPPGNYIIAGFRTNKNHYNMSRSKRSSYQKIIRIKQGGLQFVGSYKVRVTKKGKLNFGSFKVSQLQRPGERDVLKYFYDVTEGTVWQNKISRRLKQLYQ